MNGLFVSREKRVFGRFRQGAVLSRSDASNVVRDERIVMGSAARSRTSGGAVARIRAEPAGLAELAVFGGVGGVGGVGGAGRKEAWCDNRRSRATGFAVLERVRRGRAGVRADESRGCGAGFRNFACDAPGGFSRRNLSGKNVRDWDSLGWKLILSKKTCFSIKNSFAFALF